MGDPVSWLVIEPGWEVVGSDGEQVAKVDEVVGDTGKDIFNGLAVSPGLLKSARYVPSELVGTIEEGRVHLTIPSDRFDELDEHEEPPPSEQFRAG
jgi:hypothetical protein